MGKFYGTVGYLTTTETAPGVWTEQIVKKNYYGDISKKMSKWQVGEGLNDDKTYSAEVSIVADAFAYENFSCIRFIEFMGAKWKITAVEIQRPRLILTTGGLYIDTDEEDEDDDED